TGDIEWRQDTEAAGVSAATVFQDLVYVTTRKGDAFAIDPSNGRIQWQIGGPESGSNGTQTPAPAVTDKWALFPLGTGEVYSTFRRGGIRNWTSSVSGRRLGLAVGQINDLTGGPVVSGTKVFVGNAAGRTVALDLETGDRLWTAQEGVASRIIASGGSLFFVNDLNALVRLSAADGSVIWRQDLPRYTRENPRRWDGIFVHYGPVLAGGRLTVASSDGMLRSFDPRTGALVGSIEIGAAAAAPPSVANGTLYVLTTNGKLTAFR
ncbi:MAG: PQQ-binding-like beta-propeller repeat protein, partial [Pseudomonadota bacterium]